MQFLLAPPPAPPPLFTLLSKLCMHLLQRRTVKLLQSYITTSFCVDIDHFKAKCGKLFHYISFSFCCCCCCFTICQRNIFTPCVVTYPTVRKHHFRQHFIWNCHKIIYPFSYFLPIQIPEWDCLGDTENPYETCLWFAVDFNNLKFSSSSSVDAFEITLAVFFSKAVYHLFSMCFVLHVLTINDFFFINSHWNAWLFFFLS